MLIKHYPLKNNLFQTGSPPTDVTYNNYNLNNKIRETVSLFLVPSKTAYNMIYHYITAIYSGSIHIANMILCDFLINWL